MYAVIKQNRGAFVRRSKLHYTLYTAYMLSHISLVWLIHCVGVLFNKRTNLVVQQIKTGVVLQKTAYLIALRQFTGIIFLKTGSKGSSR